MGLKTLFKTLADQNGIELSDSELEELGLSTEEEEEAAAELSNPSGVLEEEIPGTAAGRVELFLAADSTAKTEAVEKDGLMWYPIIREGQWALRPSQTGQKKRTPLKVVSGKSKNQRKQIGLQDLVDAHEDQAIQHVTVPTSHANTLAENQGFIDKLKIVKGTVKDLKTKKDVDVDVLMGGYRITEPEAKGKLERGTWANRSAGILYDYVNTETGKTYPAVIEHVALTNKPWITGMESFGRKLSGSAKLDTVGLSLSDEGPTDDEYALILSDESELEDADSDFLAVKGATWDHESSPSWLQAQVDAVLNEARAKKRKAAQAASGGKDSFIDYDYPPYYRCREAKPGAALIADGYGDDANYWVAPITVKDGTVQVSAFSEWTSSKKAYVPDDRPAPAANKLPLDQDQTSGTDGESAPPKSRLQLAQEARKARSTTPEPDTDNNPREVVGNMAGENVQLSEEAQRAIQAAEARAAAAEERATALSERLDRVTGTVQGNEVDKYIAWLKDPEKGLGLSEESGFGGMLTVIRELMLSDDGQPAVQADCFADDANANGELSLSESIQRIFAAAAKTGEAKAKLGEALSQPADEGKVTEAGSTGTPESGTNASTGTEIGKPGAGEPEGEHLSAEEKAHKLAKENPALAAVLGGVPTIKKEEVTA